MNALSRYPLLFPQLAMLNIQKCDTIVKLTIGKITVYSTQFVIYLLPIIIIGLAFRHLLLAIFSTEGVSGVAMVRYAYTATHYIGPVIILHIDV
ncbi:hypothetical protein F4821DRAFT_232265 [Hypoxylon rubiginosum]|uniref:Uncharacterized protein n=1 Tax=Hypoxylon rubiginosum TaxID=110542 RepID=A0ACC0D9A0_9PEZI|nr:hypothetical protein F4821DRAFT_232265 [Hypoxylon rubiginosum]